MNGSFARGRALWILLLAAALCFSSDATRAQPAATEPSIGWALQSVARAMETDPGVRGKDTDISRMLAAYRTGVPFFVKSDGSPSLYAAGLGIAPEDWRLKRAELAFEDRLLAGEPPELLVTRDDQYDGDCCALLPIKIAEDLWVSVTMVVVSKDSPSPQLAGRDFLVSQVDIAGGEPDRLTLSPLIERTTTVDFWSEKNKQRITIDEWREQKNQWHTSTRVYGPLFYRVLASEPEYLLLGERKISLSESFRKGCKELCRKVSELRVAKGQTAVPRCRGPEG